MTATSYKDLDEIDKQNKNLLTDNDEYYGCYWVGTIEDTENKLTVDFKGKEHTFHGIGIKSIHSGDSHFPIHMTVLIPDEYGEEDEWLEILKVRDIKFQGRDW